MIALLLGVALAAPLQTKGLEPSLSTADELNASLDSRRYALLIGVDAYEDPAFPELSFAGADAAALGEALSRSAGGFDDVTVLTTDGVDRAAVFEALRGLAKQVRKDDVALVYFSGHGTRVPDGEIWRRFLLTSDSDPRRLERTAIDLADLQSFFSELAPLRKALVIDACFNGDGKSVVRPDAEPEVEPEHPGALSPRVAALGLGEAHLFATSAGRPSVEDDQLGHGVYTWYLLQALGWAFDEADRDDDRTVTAWEAHDYARGEVVARTNGLQVPEAALRVVGEADVVLGGSDEDRDARDGALVYLYPGRNHVLDGAALVVDGRTRGTLPGTVVLEPGRRHIAVTDSQDQVVTEGWMQVQPGRTYRAEELERLVRGVPGGIRVASVFVFSPPFSVGLGPGAVGIDVLAYRRLTEGRSRGQYFGVHFGGAQSPNRNGQVNARGLGWTGLEGGYQTDSRRLRARLGLSATVVVMPPDRNEDTPRGTDPSDVPDQAGWLFPAGGAVLEAGVVLSEMWTAQTGLRGEVTVADPTWVGSVRAVPWLTTTLGLEATF